MVEIITCVCVFAIIGLYAACSITDNRGPSKKITTKGGKIPYWKTTRGRKIGARITLTVMTLWILGVFIGALFVDMAPWTLFFVVFGVTLLGLIVIRTISKWIGFDTSCSPEELEHASKIIEAKAQAEKREALMRPKSHMIIPPVIKP